MDKQSAEQLINLTSTELLEKLDYLKDHAVALGRESAELEAAYKAIKEILPSKLAEIQVGFMGEGSIANEARVKALASPLYQAQVSAMIEAERAHRLKEVEYRAYIKSIEALTAISYVRNNELKLAR